jgi:phage/plasmid-like protein (TIGR03299 family)
MAHEIEYRADRKAWSFAFVGERSAIWHRHGQQAQESWSPDEWQKAAGHDFTVSKVPLFAIPKENTTGNTREIDTHMALIREDTGNVLSIVSTEWKPAQNGMAYDFADPLIKAGFASINTGGTLFDGRRCFLLLKTKEGFQLPGGDATEGYILLQISHDYGIADFVLPTSVRVVCNNTLQFALSKKNKSQMDAGKFVHTGKTSFSVDKAQVLIEAYRMGLGEYADKARFLAGKRASPEQVRAYVNKVFKLEELRDGTASEIAKRRDHNQRVVKDLLTSIERQPGAQMSAGSWWSAFHGVTYWEDHGRYEKRETEPLASKFQGASADRKQQALKVALEMAA